MSKKLLFTIIIVMIIAVTAFFYFGYRQDISHNVVEIKNPQEGYIHFLNNTISQFYLVNSDINYSTYERDIGSPGIASYAKTGDACLIIKGIVKNDYNNTYWVPLTARLYNEKGEEVGVVITDPAHPTTQAKYFQILRNNVNTFSLQVKYDKKDVASYIIFISRDPIDFPPP